MLGANASVAHLEAHRRRASLSGASDSDDDVSSVLVLYCGGTIGMVPTKAGLAPKPGFLAESLAKRRAFHDKARALFTTPVTRLGGRIHYEIREYDPILDSSNMTARHWGKVARDIYDAYNDYDAFIILHGTDTLAYTASALSFMLMHLGRTVILTGSAIPLSYEPNDATENLGGALLIAGHFDIPEVTIFFRDQLFRGNRTTKLNAAGLDAFASGNCAPLAQVGVSINVRWDLVRTPQETEQERGLRVATAMESDVGVLVLFPGISGALVRQFLAPPLRGCVIETFGAGNPPNKPDVLDALKEACARGVVIVNITQCFHGVVVHGQYSVSSALNSIGVLPGYDMTREAALTKLAWVLKRYEGNRRAIRTAMTRSLRGELDEQHDTRRSWRKEGRQSRRSSRRSSRKNSRKNSRAAETVALAREVTSGATLSDDNTGPKIVVQQAPPDEAVTGVSTTGNANVALALDTAAVAAARTQKNESDNDALDTARTSAGGDSGDDKRDAADDDGKTRAGQVATAAEINELEQLGTMDERIEDEAAQAQEAALPPPSNTLLDSDDQDDGAPAVTRHEMRIDTETEDENVSSGEELDNGDNDDDDDDDGDGSGKQHSQVFIQDGSRSAEQTDTRRQSKTLSDADDLDDDTLLAVMSLNPVDESKEEAGVELNWNPRASMSITNDEVAIDGAGSSEDESEPQFLIDSAAQHRRGSRDMSHVSLMAADLSSKGQGGGEVLFGSPNNPASQHYGLGGAHIEQPTRRHRFAVRERRRGSMPHSESASSRARLRTVSAEMGGVDETSVGTRHAKARYGRHSTQVPLASSFDVGASTAASSPPDASAAMASASARKRSSARPRALIVPPVPDCVLQAVDEEKYVMQFELGTSSPEDWSSRPQAKENRC